MPRPRKWISCTGAAISVALLRAPWAAFADPAPPPAPTDQQRADKELELRGVQDTLRKSEEQRRAIETEIDSVRADRARLSAALIETTAKVQDAERGAAAATDKLASLNATADELSRSLDAPVGGDRRRACRAPTDGQPSSPRHFRQA